MKYEDSIYVSFIIPVHNCGSEIERTIHKLLQNNVVWTKSEIILIENGSSDDTYEKCVVLQDKYSMIKVLQSNKANVSSARNLGVKNAKGKYLFYLDADDELAVGTVENVISYFDKVYDEVDLVTYPIETVFKGKVLAPHFRYKYLVEDGVYDLKEHPYIGQTTMNIVVKNKFDNNILFDESQSFSEDQRYCCDVLKEKLRMGFCNKGKYIYYRSPDSASGRLSGACYIFEQCMSFFEALFDGYDEVPLAFQGLYVNDIYWKMLNNILFPHHYEEQEFNKAIERIKRLLLKCTNSVILEHPQIDFFEKFYMLRMKHEDTLKWATDSNSFSLWDSDKLVVKEQSMEIVVTSLKVKEDKVRIGGFLKSVFFQFYNDEVILCALENNGKVTRKLLLSESSHSYYLSHEKTQRFWSFQYSVDVNDVKDMSFKVYLGGYWFPTHYYFMPTVSLSHFQKRYRSYLGNVKIELVDNNRFAFQKVTRAKKQLWLYYDCVGVSMDNGMLQFKHDVNKNDCVERYYIVTDKIQERQGIQKKHLIRFGSRKHKQLLKRCTKILTAYIEEANILPYQRNVLDKYSKYFDFEVIYLQHGVLHAVMPWKYSSERIMADRIVVSTHEEADLFKQNGFLDDCLIKTGMPRFESLHCKKERERIVLFAPSWRSYLVGEYSQHQWTLNEKKFVSSMYYKKTVEFLISEELAGFLQENNLRLDVKLHPIFDKYSHYFKIDSDRIKLISESRDDSKYCMFITDFSSYAYNFEYLNIPVIHFIPDYDEFRCGMNGYRELNYGKDFWTEVSSSVDSVIKKMKDVLEGKYLKKNINFYPIQDVTEEIYRGILE